MKEFASIVSLMFVFTYVVGEFGVWEDLSNHAKTVHNYEYKSLELAKKNRLLIRENASLKTKLSRLQAEKEHLKLTVTNKEKRTIASIPQKKVNDLVDFELYKWSADKLLDIGKQSLHFKKYEKSAQFYNALIQKYAHSQVVNDKVLFEAGIAAYESKKHYGWAVSHFNKIVKKYPGSELYRGAKLWLALSHYHDGNNKEFLATVEEFRAKYRNTQEWKVLSQYYEDIAYKHKK